MLKPNKVPAEKRQFGRRHSGSHGWVKVRGRPAIACVVKNISQGGALLEFQAAEMLPYRFRIVIESEGIDCDCDTRHQNGNLIGVEFIRAEKRAEAPRLKTEDVTAWRGNTTPSRR